MAINGPDNRIARTDSQRVDSRFLQSSRIPSDQVDYRPTQISGVVSSSTQSPFAMAFQAINAGANAFSHQQDNIRQDLAAKDHWTNKMNLQELDAFNTQMLKYKQKVISGDPLSIDWQSQVDSYQSWLDTHYDSSNPHVRLAALQGGLQNINYDKTTKSTMWTNTKAQMRQAKTDQRQAQAHANATISQLAPVVDNIFVGQVGKNNPNLPDGQIVNNVKNGVSFYRDKYVQLLKQNAQDSGQQVDFSNPQLALAIQQHATLSWSKQFQHQTQYQGKAVDTAISTANNDYATQVSIDPMGSIWGYQQIQDSPNISPQRKVRLSDQFVKQSTQSLTSAVTNGKLNPLDALSINEGLRSQLGDKYDKDFNDSTQSILKAIGGRVYNDVLKSTSNYQSQTDANPQMAAFIDGKTDQALAQKAISLGFSPNKENPKTLLDFDTSNKTPMQLKVFDGLLQTRQKIKTQLKAIDGSIDSPNRQTLKTLGANFTNLSPQKFQVSDQQSNQMWNNFSSRRQFQTGRMSATTAAALGVGSQILSKPPSDMSDDQKMILSIKTGQYDGLRTNVQRSIPSAALGDLKDILNGNNPIDLVYAASFIKANGGTYGQLVSRSGLTDRQLSMAVEVQKYFSTQKDKAPTQSAIMDFYARRQQILNARQLDDGQIRKLVGDTDGTDVNKLIGKVMDAKVSNIPSMHLHLAQTYFPQAAKNGQTDFKGMLKFAFDKLSKGSGIKVIKDGDAVTTVYDPSDNYHDGYQYKAPKAFYKPYEQVRKFKTQYGTQATNTFTHYKISGYSKNPSDIQPTDQGGFINYLVDRYRDDVLKYNPELAQYPNATFSVDWARSQESLPGADQRKPDNSFGYNMTGPGGQIIVTIPGAVSGFTMGRLMGPNQKPLTIGHNRNYNFVN